MRLFPGGAGEAIRLFSALADQSMADRMAGAKLDGLGVSVRVTMAIRLRIEALTPHREAARRAAGFLAMPQNATFAVLTPIRPSRSAMVPMPRKPATMETAINKR